jgi:anti-sigma B factor antagonist
MRFEESKVGNLSIAKVLESRITADVAPRFKQDLIGFVTKVNRPVILDLSGVTFIDSSGLGALIGSLKVMSDNGELVLCGARDSVAGMFVCQCGRRRVCTILVRLGYDHECSSLNYR